MEMQVDENESYLWRKTQITDHTFLTPSFVVELDDLSYSSAPFTPRTSIAFILIIINAFKTIERVVG